MEEAVLSGDLQRVQELIKSGVGMNVLSPGSRSLLMAAVVESYIQGCHAGATLSGGRCTCEG